MLQRVLLLLSVATCLLASSILRTEASRLACGVCEAIVDEVNAGIAETALTHSVQTRFRVDEKKRVPYARTEHNLLEIIESSSFVRKVGEKYGVVKAHTRSASVMKKAYKEYGNAAEETAAAASAAPADAAPAAAAATEEAVPVAPETPVSATDTLSEGEVFANDVAPPAAAAAGSEGTDAAASSAGATLAAPAIPPVAPVPPQPFRAPSASLPLALENNLPHLALLSSTRGTGLVVESGKKISAEIKAEVERFMEEHLDEAVLMFHRDVPDLKRKLCAEATGYCKPQQRKRKAPVAAAAASATEEQPAATQEQPLKEEL